MSNPSPFHKLGLSKPLLTALSELGYEAPTPIQEQSIPVLIQGGDLLAQAQTGTGKTAAFALPILTKIDLALQKPQALIIAPTRELAIQVAEALQSYGKHLSGFHVAPIYGGQDYRIQLRALQRGTHVIVGTPGRVMDHLRRGTMTLESLNTVVLDEADEMLKMGFIDDIEWILEQIKQSHQTALFSATMPTRIQKISKRYLKDAKKIQIETKTATVDATEQYYLRVSRKQKLEVLTRLLEVEDVQAAIIFTRTKTMSQELADKLQARGYNAAALNGDMNQSQRERVIGQIKRGQLDIIVATDVAARGIDVESVTHVINYDIPCDAESYIHRIGRTGRAGRKGKALLFVAPREDRLLNDIERTIHKKITQIEPPTIQQLNEARSKQLAAKVIHAAQKQKKLQPYYDMVDLIKSQSDYNSHDIAAALAYLMHQSSPISSQEIEYSPEPEFTERRRQRPHKKSKDKGKRKDRFKDKGKDKKSKHKKDSSNSLKPPARKHKFGKDKPAKKSDS